MVSKSCRYASNVENVIVRIRLKVLPSRSDSAGRLGHPERDTDAEVAGVLKDRSSVDREGSIRSGVVELAGVPVVTLELKVLAVLAEAGDLGVRASVGGVRLSKAEHTDGVDVDLLTTGDGGVEGKGVVTTSEDGAGLVVISNDVGRSVGRSVTLEVEVTTVGVDGLELDALAGSNSDTTESCSSSG